jgi:hypothetical protein
MVPQNAENIIVKGLPYYTRNYSLHGDIHFLQIPVNKGGGFRLSSVYQTTYIL